jgi:hypothetical protein
MQDCPEVLNLAVTNAISKSYFVSFSRGAGAASLPEREVSSQNPLLTKLGKGQEVSNGNAEPIQ